MKQNRHTELLGHSFLKVTIKVAPHTPPDSDWPTERWSGVLSLPTREQGNKLIEIVMPTSTPIMTMEGSAQSHGSPIKNRRNYGKKRIWGLWAWGVIFTVNLKLRIGRKFRIIILLHFGLVTFNSHSPKFPKVIIFMISGPSGHDHGPQKPIILNFGSV